MPAVYVHFALPCGTFSLARKFDGLGPAPLRSDKFLRWLPHSKAADLLKVTVANDLTDFVLRLMNKLRGRGTGHAGPPLDFSLVEDVAVASTCAASGSWRERFDFLRFWYAMAEEDRPHRYTLCHS